MSVSVINEATQVCCFLVVSIIWDVNEAIATCFIGLIETIMDTIAQASFLNATVGLLLLCGCALEMHIGVMVSWAFIGSTQVCRC
jgi:hypothetical protein